MAYLATRFFGDAYPSGAAYSNARSNTNPNADPDARSNAGPNADPDARSYSSRCL